MLPFIEKLSAHSTSPARRSDVERLYLARPVRVGVSAPARGDEANDVTVDGNPRDGILRTSAVKAVEDRSSLHVELVKKLTRKYSSVRELPGRDVHLGDRSRVGADSPPQLKGLIPCHVSLLLARSALG